MSSNVHIPFITLRFGGTSLSWRARENRPDYFTSLEHKRITDGANTAKIRLTYAPKNDDNINFIEDAIITSGGLCQFEYGDLGRSSSRYQGLVHGYKVNIDNGVLIYDLVLISQIARYSKAVYGGYNATSSLDDPDRKTVADIEDAIRTLVSSHFKSYEYVSKLDFGEHLTFTTINVPGGCSPVEALRSFMSQLRIRKLWRSEEVDQGRSMILQDNRIRKLYDNSVKPNSVGSTLYDKYNGVDHSANYHLALEIDDSGSGKGRISIVMVKGGTPQSSYVFKWGTKDGNVLSWSPEFDGLYSISKATGSQTYLSTKQDANGYEFSVVESQIPQIKEGVVCSSYFEAAENISINKSEIDRHYPYKASLTVLGNPDRVEIGRTTVQVIPMVAGQPHHSAGVYTILGVTDNVSSDGFTTTYDLVKASSSLSPYGSLDTNVKVYHDGSMIPTDLDTR